MHFKQWKLTRPRIIGVLVAGIFLFFCAGRFLGVPSYNLYVGKKIGAVLRNGTVPIKASVIRYQWLDDSLTLYGALANGTAVGQGVLSASRIKFFDVHKPEQLAEGFYSPFVFKKAEAFDVKIIHPDDEGISSIAEVAIDGGELSTNERLEAVKGEQGKNFLPKVFLGDLFPGVSLEAASVIMKDATISLDNSVYFVHAKEIIAKEMKKGHAKGLWLTKAALFEKESQKEIVTAKLFSLNDVGGTNYLFPSSKAAIVDVVVGSSKVILGNISINQIATDSDFSLDISVEDIEIPAIAYGQYSSSIASYGQRRNDRPLLGSFTVHLEGNGKKDRLFTNISMSIDEIGAYNARTVMIFPYKNLDQIYAIFGVSPWEKIIEQDITLTNFGDANEFIVALKGSKQAGMRLFRETEKRAVSPELRAFYAALAQFFQEKGELVVSLRSNHLLPMQSFLNILENAPVMIPEVDVSARFTPIDE